MVEVVDGTVNLDSLEVSDMIEIGLLQDFLDHFALGMNCAAIAIDQEGRKITSPSYYREFCRDYIQQTHQGDAKCSMCYQEMGMKAARAGKPYVGKCHANLIEFACPIIIKGQHVGTVLCGQISETSLREEQMEQLSKELGVDSAQLWSAASKIEVVPMKNIQAIAEVLQTAINAMVEKGYYKLEVERLTKALADNFHEISKTIETLALASQEMAGSQDVLSEKIAEVSSVTKEISDILKAIAKITSQTKLLGLNASIEAARVGNEGRTFAVVAKEIHTLSESSNETVLKIDDLNGQIREKIGSTIEDSKITLENTKQQTQTMESLQKMVEDSVGIARVLEGMFQ
jgi:ligand-binding sensor protein